MSKDDRVYGTRANEIHPFFKTKREWSKVKDRILKDYITCYLRTIHGRGRPIFIVDGFAGPGRFGDESEGSPLIICNAIQSAPKRGVAVGCLFSDSHPAHRDALESCLANHMVKSFFSCKRAQASITPASDARRPDSAWDTALAVVDPVPAEGGVT